MSRPYLLLTLAVAALALALTVLGRTRGAEAPSPAAAVAPAVDLTIVVGANQVSPPVASIPKGHLVRLRVEHRGPRPARLALTGYEDRLAIPALAPGSTWRAEFIADRPGDDFAWLLDGQPAGRFVVTGSHLVEGHR